MCSAHTPLCWAAWRGDTVLVQLLLAGRCNKDQGDCNGRTALYWAAQKGHNMVVEQLLAAQCGKDIADNELVTPLAAAAKFGRVQVVELLLEAQCNPNYADVFENTALHMAIMWARRDGNGKAAAVVKLLVAAGCHTDTVYRYGQTPLYLAAERGYTLMVSHLLRAADCNKNTADENNVTALAAAVKNGHIEVVQLLLEAGCDIDKVDCNEATAIFWAALMGNTHMVRLLLAAGARTDIANQCGYTPLHAAYRGRHSDVMRLLQEHEHLVQKLRNEGLYELQNIKDYYNQDSYTTRFFNAGSDVARFFTQ